MSCSPSNQPCYFCGEVIKSDATIHHILPRRYFIFTELANQPKNLFPAHSKCHRRWNAEYDKLSYDKEMYEVYMVFLDWGKDIFNKTLDNSVHLIET